MATDAFHALQKGDSNKHDKLIHQHIDQLAAQCEVIILAQFSMARALKSYGKSELPILTSPESSCTKIVEMVSS